MTLSHLGGTKPGLVTRTEDRALLYNSSLIIFTFLFLDNWSEMFVEIFITYTSPASHGLGKPDTVIGSLHVIQYRVTVFFQDQYLPSEGK